MTKAPEIHTIIARAEKVILWANIVMIAMVIVHDIDHVRQAHHMDYTIRLELWLVNLSVYTPSFAALAMWWKRWQVAAPMTVVNGIFVGAAFSEVHLWRPTIPVWGMWNDNFFKLGADNVSWTVLAMTVFVGACVAMAGTYAAGLYWAANRKRAV
ncbi:MAG: hypothetical protein CL955_01260 [Erythrobacteraceae bacterium]|nr:hypothetical protein [Erythrobacteraceae bacterium]|tara:strand:+ start:670 stop:1134 length:465 start_codon:yes stop_codon:yes gene_type:complete